MEKNKKVLDEIKLAEKNILEKINGKSLSIDEINRIVKLVNSGDLSDKKIILFLKSIMKNGMTMQETYYMTDAMLKSGETIKWGNNLIVDKHCIGGIPGNRTTPIVVSICAAAGLTMPKTSSRSITSAAGTADVVEVLSNVSLPTQELQKIVKKHGACMAWGGSLGLAPADEKLIRMERKMNMDPSPQIVASIMSKKLASGSNCILIDIPTGRGAKFDLKGGKNLAKYFFKVAKDFNVKLDVVFTDGSEPIGNGIGPVLEMLDVLSVLKNENKVLDLEKKSIFLAGKLLELSGKSKRGEGEKLSRDLLNSGKAFEKFNEIIKAQGEVKNPILQPARFSCEIKSRKSGKIMHWDNKDINSLGKIIGCPEKKTAGLYIYKHVGDKVVKNETVLTLYAESNSDLSKGKNFVKNHKLFHIK